VRDLEVAMRRSGIYTVLALLVVVAPVSAIAAPAGCGTQTCAATVTPSPAVPAPAAAAASPAETAELLRLVNAHRAAHGLAQLTVDPALTEIARSHTARMTAAHDIWHNDPLFTRSSHHTLGISVLGENVAKNFSVAGTHAVLLGSPPHRHNIELPEFRLAGFAVQHGSNGMIFVTEDFGSARSTPGPTPLVRHTSKPARPVAAPAHKPRTSNKPATTPHAKVPAKKIVVRRRPPQARADADPPTVSRTLLDVRPVARRGPVHADAAESSTVAFALLALLLPLGLLPWIGRSRRRARRTSRQT
jgi:uncharacterized protein YkwD